MSDDAIADLATMILEATICAGPSNGSKEDIENLKSDEPQQETSIPVAVVAIVLPLILLVGFLILAFAV